MRWLAAAQIMSMVAVGPQAASAPKADTSAPPAIVEKCRADLVKRLGVEAGEIKVVSSEPVTWPSSALGLPKPGVAYTTAMVPGWRVVLSASGSRQLYTTSSSTVQYAGPAQLWENSLLYLKPIANEPNHNCYLMQSSLLGTGAVRLLTGVHEVYPQSDGSIMAMRRTSRSGFDLLYLAPGATDNATKVHKAFAFGAATVNSATGMWAAFIRRGLGSTWCVGFGSVRQFGDAKYITLPDDVQPQAIAWTDKGLFLRVREGDRARVYCTSPGDANAAVKPVHPLSFPGAMDMVLSRSETLVARQVEGATTPTVEVVVGRFTGEEIPVARIPGMVMEDCQVVGEHFLFIWGRNGDNDAAATVDLYAHSAISVDVPGASWFRVLPKAPRVTPLSAKTRTR